MNFLFARPHEIRAMLAGDEFVVIRPLKPQPDHTHCNVGGNGVLFYTPGISPVDVVTLPYATGDLVCVKEAWARTINVDGEKSWPGRPNVPLCGSVDTQPFDVLIYRADGPWEWRDDDGYETDRSYWRGPQNMRPEHSRLSLSVTGVAVKRLHDVTEEGARQAGDELEYAPDFTVFMPLWNQHNRAYPWDSNPWIVAAKCTVHLSNIKDMKETAA